MLVLFTKFYIFSQSLVTWIKFNLPLWGKIWEGYPPSHIWGTTLTDKQKVDNMSFIADKDVGQGNSDDFTESLIQTVQFVCAPVMIISPI